MGETKYGQPGRRSDLYAFGATWYRLLSGRHPNNRRTKYLPDGSPEALFELIQDLLEHDPKDRPESAEAVLVRLAGICPVEAPSGHDVPEPPLAALPKIENIHGWPTAKVQALQQATAEALGRTAVFRDREFSVRIVEKIQTGQRLVRKRWFNPDEYDPIYVDREATATVAPPDMVIIPAGRFLMGSSDREAGRFDSEGPQHEVTISRPFAIGRCAVTFDDYNAFCAATGREKQGDVGRGRGRYPVSSVSGRMRWPIANGLPTRPASPTAYPPRRSGNTPAARGPSRPSTLARSSPPTRPATMAPNPTPKAQWFSIAGASSRWGASRPTPGASTRSMATSGSGARTGMDNMRQAQSLTLSDLPRARGGSCGAAVRSPTPAPCAPRTASNASPPHAPTGPASDSR